MRDDRERVASCVGCQQEDRITLISLADGSAPDVGAIRAVLRQQPRVITAAIERASANVEGTLESPTVHDASAAVDHDGADAYVGVVRESLAPLVYPGGVERDQDSIRLDVAGQVAADSYRSILEELRRRGHVGAERRTRPRARTGTRERSR